VTTETTWRFRVPETIVFGWGAIERIGEETAKLGRRALLVTGRTARGAERVERLLAAAGVEATRFAAVEPEPGAAVVDRGAAAARTAGCDVIVGFGGGSPMDVAKCIAGMLGMGAETIVPYLRGEPVAEKARPLVCAPTTAGTSAEITRNAVILDEERGVKIGLRAAAWIPRAALIDPELTLTAPPQLTAQTGLDVLTHAAEGYVSRAATEPTDALALPAVRLVGRYLRAAVREGSDRAAREGMCLASLCAGMAFANSGVGAAHSLAHPLGARYHVAHGAACGLLLPYVMEYNLPAAPEKMRDLAAALEPENSNPRPADAPAAVSRLLADLELPQTLRAVGVAEEALAGLAAAAMVSGALRTNPRAVGEPEAREILRRALGG